MRVSTRSTRVATPLPSFGTTYRLAGVDLTTLAGIAEGPALVIRSVLGTDRHRWPRVHHGCRGRRTDLLRWHNTMASVPHLLWGQGGRVCALQDSARRKTQYRTPRLPITLPNPHPHRLKLRSSPADIWMTHISMKHDREARALP